MSTPIYPLVDKILDGGLAEALSERRRSGDSYESISRWLHTEHDIQVTSETVRKWCVAAERSGATS